LTVKILIIHNKYKYSGGEREAVRAQINLLNKKGHSVILFTKDNREIQDFSILEKIKLFPDAIYSRDVYRQVKHLVLRENIDVAHVHNVFPLISPSVYHALADCHIPTIQTIHNYRFLCPNGLFFINGKVCELCKFGNTTHAVRQKCFRDSYILSGLYALGVGLHRNFNTFQKINHFITLTDFSRQKLIESGLTPEKNISVLGHFLERIPGTDEISYERQNYVLYLGRLSEEKGINILIDAFKDIKDIDLIIAGIGPLDEDLRRKVSKNNSSNIKFVGFVNSSKKNELLKEAKSTIVPSICYENFGIVVLESLSYQTPVIASRIGGLPHLIDDGETGLLYSPEDPLDFREKLDYLLNNPDLSASMGLKGRNYVIQNFSETSYYNKLMKIYEEVMS
jgi:glycosyltransferase involved in cell wall biosynthesis